MKKGSLPFRAQTKWFRLPDERGVYFVCFGADRPGVRVKVVPNASKNGWVIKVEETAFGHFAKRQKDVKTAARVLARERNL